MYSRDPRIKNSKNEKQSFSFFFFFFGSIYLTMEWGLSCRIRCVELSNSFQNKNEENCSICCTHVTIISPYKIRKINIWFLICNSFIFYFFSPTFQRWVSRFSLFLDNERAPLGLTRNLPSREPIYH